MDYFFKHQILGGRHEGSNIPASSVSSVEVNLQLRHTDMQAWTHIRPRKNIEKIGEMTPEPRAPVQEQAEKKITDLEKEAKEPCAV